MEWDRATWMSTETASEPFGLGELALAKRRYCGFAAALRIFLPRSMAIATGSCHGITVDSEGCDVGGQSSVPVRDWGSGYRRKPRCEPVSRLFGYLSRRARWHWRLAMACSAAIRRRPIGVGESLRRVAEEGYADADRAHDLGV